MRSFLLVIAAALAAPGVAEAQSSAGPSAWSPRARAEIFAALIVRGKIQSRHPEAFDRAIENGGGYVELDVRVHDVLKGSCGEHVRVTVFAAPRGHPHGYSPCAEDLRNQLGRERILMLQRVGRRIFLADRFHGEASLPANPSELAKVQSMIAYHAILAETTPQPDVPYAEQVTEILGEISEDSICERLAFIRLQALGPEAIPAIVRHLEDRRSIRGEEVVVLKHAASTEGPFRSIRARQVRDALFAVLQELAGTNLGIDPERADDALRELGSQRWRIYSRYALSANASPRRQARSTSRH